MSFTYNKEDADSTFILRVIDEDGNMQKKVFSASVDPYYHQNIDSAEIRKIARRLIYFGNRGNGRNTYCVANIDECRI